MYPHFHRLCILQRSKEIAPLDARCFCCNINLVMIEFDPAKDVANLRKHGVSLALAVDFEWETARIDARFDYKEQRFKATGYIGMRLYG